MCWCGALRAWGWTSSVSGNVPMPVGIYMFHSRPYRGIAPSSRSFSWGYTWATLQSRCFISSIISYFDFPSKYFRLKYCWKQHTSKYFRLKYCWKQNTSKYFRLKYCWKQNTSKYFRLKYYWKQNTSKYFKFD